MVLYPLVLIKEDDLLPQEDTLALPAMIILLLLHILEDVVHRVIAASALADLPADHLVKSPMRASRVIAGRRRC